MRFLAVADTHTVLWYLYGDDRLSITARSVISQAAVDRLAVAVSSISLVEVAYLVEKGRVLPTAYEDLSYALSDPQQVFVEVPLTTPVADWLRHVSRTAVPDMPDRIIAATGLHLGVPIISRDGRIRAANLKTIW